MTGPLGRISLGLSGGGTRAAGFHLGALWYLDHLGVLTDVAVISSASGGSFINSTYAMSQAQGKSFADYCDWMLDRLRTAEMVKYVLDDFANGTPVGLAGRRTIIASLAEAYNDHFFEDFRFGDFLDKEPGHLNEVIINATDFRTGLGFRFQRRAPAGNALTQVDPRLLRHVRLADVMASSSCLPGGMEPFFFPEDFAWDSAEAKQDAETIRAQFSKLGVESIPLMDGGLYDNQGLEGMMEAAARIALNDDSPDGLDHAVVDAQKVWMMGDDTQQVPGEFDLLFQRVACGDLPESPPGLVIISDAPVEPIPIYGAGYVQNGSTPLKTVPEPAHTGPTLGVATIWWRILVLLCAGTAITEAYELASGWIYEHRLPHLNFAELFQYVIPLILSVAALATLLWLRSTGKKVLAGVDGILKIEGNAYKQKTGVPTSWPYLKHLRLSQLGYLLNVRATSMLSLVSDIFFIRHRILGFALLYMLPGWRRQLVSNEIYDLGVDGPSDAPTPTAAMIKVGATAAAEPTAFWFDRPEALEQLVAAGQMNLCRNLITWLRRERAQTKENFAPALADLLTRAEADWQTFCGDPLAMVPKSARPTSAQAAVK